MLASRVKIIIEEKGMTIRDVVALTGLSSRTILKARSTISDCQLSTLERLADALKTAVKDFFEETPDE